jgi:hypothetical protein
LAVLAAAAALRCGGAPPKAPTPTLPPPPPPRTEPIAADGSYWEEVPVSVLAQAATTRLPWDEKALDGAPAYEALDEKARARLRESGLVVRRSDAHETRLAAPYEAARAAKVPFVVTLDVLFALVTGAYGAAVAEASTNLVEPGMRVLLPLVDERLAGEQRSARSDTANAYALARNVVGVARALLDKSFVVDPASPIRTEVQRITAHLGPASSELLGRTVDYGVFDVQGAVGGDDRALAAFRARTWLSEAAMILAVRAPARAPVDVTTQRTHARAAMLLTHALDPETDVKAAQAWAQIADVESFLFGAPDDWDPRLFGRLATDAQVDLRDGGTFVNVAKVDQLRLKAGAADPAARARANDLGGATPKEAWTTGDPTPGGESPWITFRLLGASAPPDVVALGKLVSPRVGSHLGTSAPFTLRDGVRALPTALDLAAAVGSVDAREILHETGDDAYERFETVLGELASKALPADPAARHRTPYMSLLDAFASYLAPSAEDVAQPTSVAPGWRRRKVATVLGAWARLRHATIGAPRARALIDDPAPAAEDGSAFVEAHPEALARLLGTTRQLRRGLLALHGIAAGGATDALLEKLELLLLDAFDVALREAGTSPLGPKELRALDAMPNAIANLEKRLGAPAATPAIAVVHADVPGKRFLEVGTGFVEDATFVLRIPGVPNPVVLVGAHVPFVERAQSLRTTDAVFRGQLEKARTPTPAWQRGFREE